MDGEPGDPEAQTLVPEDSHDVDEILDGDDDLDGLMNDLYDENDDFNGYRFAEHLCSSIASVHGPTSAGEEAGSGVTSVEGGEAARSTSNNVVAAGGGAAGSSVTSATEVWWVSGIEPSENLFLEEADGRRMRAEGPRDQMATARAFVRTNGIRIAAVRKMLVADLILMCESLGVHQVADPDGKKCGKFTKKQMLPMLISLCFPATADPVVADEIVPNASEILADLNRTAIDNMKEEKLRCLCLRIGLSHQRRNLTQMRDAIKNLMPKPVQRILRINEFKEVMKETEK